MARVLLVGCGCRGCDLAAALVASGHAVRGTTRSEGGVGRIEAAGAEGVVADPGRLATLTPKLDGVSVLCWLMGSASGDPDVVEALHGPRLESLLETLVDTHVRGVVYEARGSVGPAPLARGEALVHAASATFRMPAEVVEQDPSDPEAWTRDMVAAVERVLAA